MTIVAGFVYSQGIMLCADMEEGDGYSKKQVNKIAHLEGNGWQVDLGGAGPSAVLDLAVKKLEREFLSYPNVEEFAVGHEQSIRTVLLAMHEQYIWPSKLKDYSMELLVALNLKESKQSFLYRTQEYIPQPVEDFCCVGTGSILGNYFASILYQPSLTRTQIMLMGAFIVREVKECISDCGSGTQMEFTMRDGRHYSVGNDVFQMTDANDLPGQYQMAEWFWDCLPQWEYEDTWFEAWDRGEHGPPDDDVRMTQVWKNQEEFQKRLEQRNGHSTSEKSE